MPQFTVIKGGLEERLKPVYTFKKAFVTDTRLMGVVGLMVQWNVTVMDEANDVCHFFYYDAEELGLDSVNIYPVLSEDDINLAWQSCFGGLGADRVELSKKEAESLISFFVEDTKNKKQSLPENIGEFDFILNEAEKLSPDEERDLHSKLCANIKTDYGVVNYFLMRQFGKDKPGERLLISDLAKGGDIDDFSFETHSCFLKNTIHEYTDSKCVVSYLTESLVETDKGYYIVTGEIRLAGKKVYYAKKTSSFQISSEEVAMLLSREEYCSVYQITVPMEDFDVDFLPFALGTTKTEHEIGDLYMDFKENNDHVEKKEFRLYEDIKAVYFVSDYGELIVAAYSRDDIRAADHKVRSGDLFSDVRVMVRMQLARSVLYDFADSGFTNFGAFIQSLE